jgi:hypothetical protein
MYNDQNFAAKQGEGPEETPDHLIFDCPALTAQRLEAYGSSAFTRETAGKDLVVLNRDCQIYTEHLRKLLAASKKKARFLSFPTMKNLKIERGGKQVKVAKAKK